MNWPWKKKEVQLLRTESFSQRFDSTIRVAAWEGGVELIEVTGPNMVVAFEYYMKVREDLKQVKKH